MRDRLGDGAALAGFRRFWSCDLAMCIPVSSSDDGAEIFRGGLPGSLTGAAPPIYNRKSTNWACEHQRFSGVGAILKYSFVDRPFSEGTAVFGEVSGSIDANTLPEFRDQIRNFHDKGRKYILLKATGLKYVNSSGLGALIKLATDFQQEGGQFAMFDVPKKIQALFEMLGILDVVKVYEDEASAFSAFSEAAAPPKTPAAKEFPLLIRCISCRRKIELPDSGYFRCPKCGTCFSVKPEGKVKGYQIDQPQAVEIRLSCEPELTGAVHEAATGLMRAKNYPHDQAEKIRQALTRACTLAMEGASRQESCFVYFVADRKEFRAAFKVDRLAFEAKGPLREVREGVDEMDIVSLPGGGQVLQLIKKIARQ